VRRRYWIALAFAIAVGAASPGSAEAGRLLAPKSACHAQESVSRSLHKQEKAMRCLVN
jgi:hypothetical protein